MGLCRYVVYTWALKGLLHHDSRAYVYTRVVLGLLRVQTTAVIVVRCVRLWIPCLEMRILGSVCSLVRILGTERRICVGRFRYSLTLDSEVSVRHSHT